MKFIFDVILIILLLFLVTAFNEEKREDREIMLMQPGVSLIIDVEVRA